MYKKTAKQVIIMVLGDFSNRAFYCYKTFSKRKLFISDILTFKEKLCSSNEKYIKPSISTYLLLVNIKLSFGSLEVFEEFKFCT